VTSEYSDCILSTKEDAGTKSDCFAAGANDYLIKLPDKVELIARIRYHSKAYNDFLQRELAERDGGKGSATPASTEVGVRWGNWLQVSRTKLIPQCNISPTMARFLKGAFEDMNKLLTACRSYVSRARQMLYSRF